MHPIVRAMEQKADLIIVGGGLNGRTLALAAASVGLRSVVLDREARDVSKDHFDGRAYALALTSINIFRALGLWPALEADAQPMLDIKVTTGRAGQGAASCFLHFDHNELEEGPMGHMVEDQRLRPVLDAAIDANDLIEWIGGAEVIGQEVDGTMATVVLSDGKVIEGHLIVGADGRGSGVAQRAGISKISWVYDQTAIVCTLAHEKPHKGEAHQFFAEGGPLAVLPLKGNRSSIVWSEKSQKAAKVLDQDEAGFLASVQGIVGTYLGALSLEGPRFGYPLGLSLARRFVGERLVLLGDAAHGIHPLAGQGLNLGLRDTAALIEVLAAARRRGQDIGSKDVLRRYEIWRRPDALALAVATDQINRLFSNTNPVLSAARVLGLGAVNALPDLRRGFMRTAAGLNGNLPKLMLGKAV